MARKRRPKYRQRLKFPIWFLFKDEGANSAENFSKMFYIDDFGKCRVALFAREHEKMRRQHVLFLSGATPEQLRQEMLTTLRTAFRLTLPTETA